MVTDKCVWFNLHCLSNLTCRSLHPYIPRMVILNQSAFRIIVWVCEPISIQGDHGIVCLSTVLNTIVSLQFPDQNVFNDLNLLINRGKAKLVCVAGWLRVSSWKTPSYSPHERSGRYRLNRRCDRLYRNKLQGLKLSNKDREQKQTVSSFLHFHADLGGKWAG